MLNLLTTEDLVESLLDFRKNTLKGGFYRFKRNDVIIERMGIRGLQSVWAYQDFRDSIRKYQVEHQISSLRHNRSVTIAGITLGYTDYYDELTVLDSDKPILKQQVWGMFSLFQYAFYKNIAYEIVEVAYDGIDESHAPFSLDEIALLTQTADYSYVHDESWDWISDGEGVYRGITLGLKWGNLNDDNCESRCFEARDLYMQ